MTRKRTLSAALATTASVALLAGVAHAQSSSTTMGPGEGRSGAAYCTSTVVSPAYNNCTMVSPNAPGGGSFPGSFLVPGTSTSFALHGILYMQAAHTFGPTSTSGGLISGTGVQGPGASASQLGAHALNGNTDMTVGPTRPNIETRTPTAYGELKTYIEFDFNMGTNGTNTVYGGAGGPAIPSSGSSQPSGNQDFIRLRQAYGTLGPWLMGQTKTLVDDVQVYPDLADAGLDAGFRTSTQVHKPQIRYTFLAGNGITLAASIEQPTKEVTSLQTVNGGAFAGYTEDNNGIAGTGGTIVAIPDVGTAFQWDQPWGHIRATGMYHDSRVDDAGGLTGTAATQANPFTSGQNGFRHDVAGYYFALSGHFNTWGKDRLAGTFGYEKAFIDASGSYGAQDEILGVGGLDIVSRAWNADANYEHFFTSQWRANLSGGYQKFIGMGMPTGNTTAEAGMPFQVWTLHANVIFSPVVQTDFISEYEHGTETFYSGASTREDRFTEQFKFYFSSAASSSEPAGPSGRRGFLCR
jgi:hypothetical protein